MADVFREVIEWIRGLGAIGISVFFVVLVSTCVLSLPSTHLFVGAGLLYGVWGGALLTTVASLTTELIVVLLARTRLRAWFDRKAQRRPKLRALVKALDQQSFVVLWLLRLSPATPFGMLNYAVAPLRISLPRRIAAHILGMGPCNVLQAYIGSMLGSVSGLSDASAPGVWRYVILAVGIVSAVIAFIITGVAMKRILDRDGDTELSAAGAR